VNGGGLSLADLLERGMAELGLERRPAAVDLLLRHLGEIETWNPALGLVKATGSELVVRHVLDSLAGVGAFASLPAGSVVVDVGSGAGFPGVPLAVVRPDLRVVLLERSSRRATFLEHCVAVLGLGGLGVHAGDARSFAGRADAVTLRAVSALSPELLRALGRLALAPLLVAYKGTEERARRELESVRGLYGSGEIVGLRVPFLEGERSLVVLRR
jgi:16S rRNA (guanine527-N7)-methyltransferase